MSNPWIAIGALAVVAIVIPVSMIVVSSLIRPSVPEQGKTAVYESGEIPTGDTRIRFNIQYYMIALLFVIFDIETVLIFPWTVIYSDAVSQFGMGSALLPMLIFIGVLGIGLVWAWRNGAVRWIGSDRARETTGGA
ncbi:NADH-quinone oxidoreductase subunit A [Halosegnis rubeus]|jgi:NADH-quinone oxidoreductase subunit A|uniref:NADH-quinone oxidoreductase subunit A n=1 Tax=Halosegnis rubeus TaxID=2212850 RepID=A0A5N5UKA1_9EURY|nr:MULTISPECIES: NADH-quinone oxidoreductase subunit A [Halobacteriales]KAB7514893.1 NADH-quinone oxidoreductase subunit A [Halosegnis rubeus]KAB7518202.1 NADH-quinone oxidoreductase subunit A [Halosegnis rubeus]KAB7519218.1 NADH-quinone oxidoreductase subunit A [Halosegnis rubeus]